MTHTPLFAVLLSIALATTVVAEDRDNAHRARKVVRVKNGELLVDGAPLKRTYIGVRLTNLTAELRDHFGAPKSSGVLVASVTPDSPAAKGGIRVGDIITSIDGKEVDSAWGVERAIRARKNGEAVQIGYIRDRNARSASVVVAEREVELLDVGHLEHLPELIDRSVKPQLGKIETYFSSPEWQARVAKLGDCGDMQSRLSALEKRLEQLEKKK